MSRAERIAASTPIDKTAAVQMSPGIHWVPNKIIQPHVRRWRDMPTDLIKPLPRGAAGSTFVDLTGRKVGRFTVVGYLAKINAKKKTLWLVRCACGMFETRTSSGVATANPSDACCDCLYLEQVKRGNGYPARGEHA